MGKSAMTAGGAAALSGSGCSGVNASVAASAPARPPLATDGRLNLIFFWRTTDRQFRPGASGVARGGLAPTPLETELGHRARQINSKRMSSSPPVSPPVNPPPSASKKSWIEADACADGGLMEVFYRRRRINTIYVSSSHACDSMRSRETRASAFTLRVSSSLLSTIRPPGPPIRLTSL